MFNIVLYAPEIPANTGNIGRTCVVTGARLHLVEPLGFSLDDKTVRRAGLGYWQNLDVTTYAGWEDFLARNGLSPADERLHLLTKKARRTYAQSTYRDGDYLVFGSESSGIPEPLLAAAPERCERIPMLRDCDSLDNAEAWEAHEESLGHTEDSHEAILQQDICGNFVNPGRLPHQRPQPLQQRRHRPLRGPTPNRLSGNVTKELPLCHIQAPRRWHTRPIDALDKEPSLLIRIN